MAPQGQEQHNEWKSSREAAHHLGISEATLYRLVDEGTIPAYRPTRSLRFRTTDLDAYLETARVQPGDLMHLRSDAVGQAARSARGRQGGPAST
jgi:excisionase family DNA binding protein